MMLTAKMEDYLKTATGWGTERPYELSEEIKYQNMRAFSLGGFVDVAEMIDLI